MPFKLPTERFKSKTIPNQLKAPRFTEDLPQLFRQQSQQLLPCHGLPFHRATRGPWATLGLIRVIGVQVNHVAGVEVPPTIIEAFETRLASMVTSDSGWRL